MQIISPKSTHNDYRINNRLTTTQNISNVLKVLNQNINWKNSSTKFNKTINTKNITQINTKNITQKSNNPNIMTEDDIDRLFNQTKSKSKLKSNNNTHIATQIHKNITQIEGKYNGENQIKRHITETQIHRLLTQSTKHKLITQSIAKIKTQKQDLSINYPQKDLANSVKFLRLDDQFDKLLTGISQDNQDDYSKIQQFFQDKEKEKEKDLTTDFKQNYLVGKIIGEGAYASVRVAIYKPLNRKIAIKVYEKSKIKEIQKKKSVRRQIRILQNLNHPNILKILDVVQTNNHLNIIMEYLSGISLGNFIKAQTNNRTPEKTCKKIIKSLAEGLKYMHNRHIAHRDIKLQNIILDQKLSPKLIDFGFSTCLKSHERVKIFCGTPSYMAPEIVQKRQYKGQPADIWALGVLFFVTLTGIFPFRGATDQQLYKKINSADYPRSQIAFSKQITDLMNKMLLINPEERITAEQILNHSWIKQKSNFKKIKKAQSPFQMYKRSDTLSHKSKQKQLSNTRKFTQTCKQNLKLELKLIKRSSDSKKFNKTCTQRNMCKQLSKCKISQKPSKGGSSSQNKQNKMNNLSSTNKKVLDLLRNEIKKGQLCKIKPQTRRV